MAAPGADEEQPGGGIEHRRLQGAEKREAGEDGRVPQRQVAGAQILAEQAPQREMRAGALAVDQDDAADGGRQK